MTERGTYADYVRWDEKRKEAFPQARHWIYKSKIGDFTVAEFDPISGECRIGKVPTS